MKKTVLVLAMLVQSAFVFAQQSVKVKSDGVNMYRQPGSTAEVVKVVNSTDDVLFIRKFDSQWSIVTVAGETGYIHNTRLPKVKNKMLR
jgi:SH3-like domain-containing protein